MSIENAESLNQKDINHAIQIDTGVWWVGHYLPDDPFQCHAYLIDNGENSVLIDPGSPLTFQYVLKKIKEVMPFSHIRYFVCQHQDPDIAGALKSIDDMPDRHLDAMVVTQSRASLLIKHYDLKMPFWNVDDHQWKLDLGSRLLEFIFTPYLHFPGAICTFDHNSGILFSSDIFGGLTSDWSLVARDESYFEDIRPFHEHYMPSREILLHGLMTLETYPIQLIAPQHGSLIPKHLVGRIISDLKQIDCGLYGMTKDITDIRRLSQLNKALREVTDAVILYRDFRDMVKQILAIFSNRLPVLSISFCAQTEDKQILYLAQENRYHGEILQSPPECCSVLNMSKAAWDKKYNARFIHDACSIPGRKKTNKHDLLIPLFSNKKQHVTGVTILAFKHHTKINHDVRHMIEQMSDVLGVAVERESIYRCVDIERKKFYNLSIKDPLTGLSNRTYMDETLKRFLSIHNRDKTASVIAVICDIDDFKSVNDTYGHDVGDIVIKKVSQVLLNNVRAGDLAVRYGGEEFALFLIDCALDDGVAIAEKIRKQIHEVQLDDQYDDLHISISAGVASHIQGESSDNLFKRADIKLLEAKNLGRDRVLVAG